MVLILQIVQYPNQSCQLDLIYYVIQNQVLSRYNRELVIIPVGALCLLTVKFITTKNYQFI